MRDILLHLKGKNTTFKKTKTKCFKLLHIPELIVTYLLTVKRVYYLFSLYPYLSLFLRGDISRFLNVLGSMDTYICLQP